MFIFRLSAINILITVVSWMIGMLFIYSLGIHLKIDTMVATLIICWIFLNWLEFKSPLE